MSESARWDTGKARPLMCRICNKPVRGEGSNPKTGVRYFSHVTYTEDCFDEITHHQLLDEKPVTEPSQEKP